MKLTSERLENYRKTALKQSPSSTMFSHQKKKLYFPNTVSSIIFYVLPIIRMTYILNLCLNKSILFHLCTRMAEEYRKEKPQKNIQNFFDEQNIVKEFIKKDSLGKELQLQGHILQLPVKKSQIKRWLVIELLYKTKQNMSPIVSS